MAELAAVGGEGSTTESILSEMGRQARGLQLMHDGMIATQERQARPRPDSPGSAKPGSAKACNPEPEADGSVLMASKGSAYP